MQKIFYKKRGASLIELLVYAAIFVTISVFVINSILTVNSAIISVRLERRININADVAMQKFIREIRLADTVNASSTLDLNPGKLSLRSVVSATNSASVDVEFYLSGGQLVLRKGSSSPLALTDSNVLASNLVFRKITASSTSVAIRVELSLQASTAKKTLIKNFYGTAILRRSYN